jgi:hypothetical protein
VSSEWFVRGASVGEASQLADRGDPLFLLGFPEEHYHVRPELSASSMKILLQSPKHFLFARAQRIVKPEWDVGTAVHCRVLGIGQPIVEIPQRLLSVADSGIRSNEAKAWVAQARAEGKIPLKPVVYREITWTAESVLRHPKARRLLEVAGHPEVSMFGPDPETGQPLRGRADRICEFEGWTILDLKTTTDLSTQKLIRTVDDFGYDLQAEVYRLLFELRTGILAQPTVLIFTEKTPPYDVRVVRLDGEWMDGGWVKLRNAIDLFRRAMDTREWPGVDEAGEISSLPTTSWYRSRLAGSEYLED